MLWAGPASGFSPQLFRLRFLCVCLGPVGPCIWFVVACQHYNKPKEVRDTLPMEAQVAWVSLLTAIITLVINLVCIIFIIVWVAGVATAIASTTGQS